jgi:four helix bundle protein
MNRQELETRTLRFALKIIAFVATLPNSKAGEVVEFQLVKAGTSVGANYREANRAESRNDFIHKLGIVEKEASESLYWLELCQEASLGNAKLRQWLLQESRELLAIFTSAGRTSKANRVTRPARNIASDF